MSTSFQGDAFQNDAFEAAEDTQYLVVARIDQVASAFTPEVIIQQFVLPGFIDQTAIARKPNAALGDHQIIDLDDLLVQTATTFTPSSLNVNTIALGVILNVPTVFVWENLVNVNTITVARIDQQAATFAIDVELGDPIVTILEVLDNRPAAFSPFVTFPAPATAKELQASASAAQTITNPPLGVTTVTGDFASFDDSPYNDALAQPVIRNWFTNGNSTATSSFTLTNPAQGATIGTLVVFISYDSQGASRTITPPSSTGFAWSTHSHTRLADNDHALAVFYKLDTAAEEYQTSSQLTFTCSISTTYVATGYWVTGTDLSQPDGFNLGQSLSGSGASTIWSPFTTTRDNELVLMGHATSTSQTNMGGPNLSDQFAAIGVTNASLQTAAFFDVPVGTTERDLRFFHQTSAPRLFAWVGLAGEQTNDVAYAGWIKLVLTSTMLLSFDTFGSDMEDTKLAIFPSTYGDSSVQQVVDDFDRTSTRFANWQRGPHGYWVQGDLTQQRFNTFVDSFVGEESDSYARITSASGFWRQAIPDVTYPTATEVVWEMRFRWANTNVTSQVEFWASDYFQEWYVYLTIRKSSVALGLTLEAGEGVTFGWVDDAVDLGTSGFVDNGWATLRLEMDRATGVMGAYYWRDDQIRPSSPQVTVTQPGVVENIEFVEPGVWHQSNPSPAGNGWLFDYIEGTRENYQPQQWAFYNDDSHHYWSAIPGGFIDNPQPMIMAPGTYYIRVWPYDGSDWDTADGNAQLNITRYTTPSEYDFVDNIEDVNTITDPVIGETYATGDFSVFTPGVSDPISTMSWWTQNETGYFTGWIKLVLTEDMYLAFDTYDSEMIDTALFIFYGDDPPEDVDYDPDDNPGSLYAFDDDTSEDPAFASGSRTQRQSFINSATYDSSARPETGLFPAGTYWILLTPYDDEWLNEWDDSLVPPEGPTAQLRITRTNEIQLLQFPRGTTPQTPPYVIPPHPQSTFTIRVDGVDITEDVKLAGSTFTYQVNGNPGTAVIEVKDADHSKVFTVGAEMTLDVGEKRMWGGYVTNAAKVYPFSVVNTDDPDATARLWRLSGVDYNILFQKRIVYDEDDEAGHISFSYPVGTYDDTIINDLFDNYLAISGDGLSRAGVTRVDVVTMDIPGVTSGKGVTNKGRGAVASAGYTWKQAMDVISRATGAVYYIDPNKVFHYVDVDTVSSTLQLKDRPTANTHIGLQGYRLMHDASKMINDMIVWGAAQDPVVYSRVEDSASIASHGRWQSGLFSTGVYKQASVELISNSYVYGTPQSKRGGKDDRISVSARLFTPEFSIGEKVQVGLSVYSYSDVLPIRRMTISFVSPTQATYDVVLSHEIDQPWSIFELPPLGNFNYNLNTYYPKPVLPVLPCIEGFSGGYVLDAFSRDILDTSDHVTGNANASWHFGDRVNWNANTFQVNSHYEVTGGRAVINCENAHYVLVFEGTYPGYLKGQTTTVGSIDFFTGDFISLKTIMVKFRFMRSKMLVPAEMTGSASGGGATWSNLSNLFDTNNAYNAFEATPNLDTSGGVGAFVTGASPVTWSVNFQPSTSVTGYGAILGTIVCGDADSNATWWGSDSGGFVRWESRYANGTLWAGGEVNSLSYVNAGTGLRYIGGSSTRAIMYEAVDERAANQWYNKLYARFTGGGSAMVEFNRIEGGSGAMGITARAQDAGTSRVTSPMALQMDPDTDYYMKWYRPFRNQSYVKVWEAGGSEPLDWQASETTNGTPGTTEGPTGTSEPSRNFGIHAGVFHMQAYDFGVELVVAGPDLHACDDASGPSTGQQPNPPDPDFDGEVYHLPFAFIKGSTQVWVNRLRVRVGSDYTEQPTAGTITFTPPIDAEDDVYVLFNANGDIV